MIEKSEEQYKLYGITIVVHENDAFFFFAQQDSLIPRKKLLLR